MSMTELGRVVHPANNARASLTLPNAASTLVVQNQLGAVLLCAYGRRPTADDWDFAIPGSALFELPLVGGENALNVLVTYPGAIPAADVQAVFWTSDCNWPAFVGAIG